MTNGFSNKKKKKKKSVEIETLADVIYLDQTNPIKSMLPYILILLKAGYQFHSFWRSIYGKVDKRRVKKTQN